MARKQDSKSMPPSGGQGIGAKTNQPSSGPAKEKPLSGKPLRGKSRSGNSRSSQKAIPDAVANRMMRRIALATGVPTAMGMTVFVVSYLLISRGIADIPTGATLVASGGCFLLGVVGLSYGVLSASWEETAGSLLGMEQIGLNISRVRQSVRAMGQAGQNPPG